MWWAIALWEEDPALRCVAREWLLCVCVTDLRAVVLGVGEPKQLVALHDPAPEPKEMACRWIRQRIISLVGEADPSQDHAAQAVLSGVKLLAIPHLPLMKPDPAVLAARRPRTTRPGQHGDGQDSTVTVRIALPRHGPNPLLLLLLLAAVRLCPPPCCAALGSARDRGD